MKDAIHHRDTEFAEIAQRLESLCPLRVLCASVVNLDFPNTHLNLHQ
jgi:hypothetical protein